MDFALGGLAACGACLLTNPLEVVKTRMQLQGELRSRAGTRPYRHVLQALAAIARADGVTSLQRGLAPALLYQLAMNGLRLGIYGLAESAGYTRHPDGHPSLPRCAIAAALAGVLGAVAGSPLYLVKTHIQAQSAAEIAVGHQHQHRGMVQALRQIWQAQGVAGLWRGAGSAVPRVAVGSATQLSTFSVAKDIVYQLEVFPAGGWQMALVAGMSSSVAVAVAMTPFDVVSTRLYNQPVGPHGEGLLYRGVADCFARTVRAEGILGLYKGLGACYFRMGPHTVLSLVFWDQLRRLWACYGQR